MLAFTAVTILRILPKKKRIKKAADATAVTPHQHVHSPFILRSLLTLAAATPQHAGRPLPAHAVIRQRAPQRPRPPIGRQRAVRVLGAVQPAGSLPHHDVWHRHAEVSLATRRHY